MGLIKLALRGRVRCRIPNRLAKIGERESALRGLTGQLLEAFENRHFSFHYTPSQFLRMGVPSLVVESRNDFLELLGL